MAYSKIIQHMPLSQRFEQQSAALSQLPRLSVHIGLTGGVHTPPTQPPAQHVSPGPHTAPLGKHAVPH